MGANFFSNTHMSTKCGLKELASGVFAGKLKSVGRMAAAEKDQN